MSQSKKIKLCSPLLALLASLAVNPLLAEPPGSNPSAMNPKISVVGTLEAVYANDPTNADNARASAKEIELQIASDIDPFSKANILLAKSGDEFSLEEGYVLIPVGPFDLQYKMGRFFTSFGKLNSVHPHAMPWLTETLMLKNYFGEKLSDDGAAVSGLLPLPFYSETSLQVINDNETSFSTADALPIYVGQWKNFFELSDDLGLETGLSLAYGKNSTGGDTTLTGFYAQLKEKLSAETYWKLHGEVLGSCYDNSGTLINTSGGMGALTFHYNREWEFGGLVESSQSPVSTARSSRIATFGSFSPSEFGNYRWQISQNIDAAGVSSQETRLQYVFVIGPHAVHPY